MEKTKSDLVLVKQPSDDKREIPDTRGAFIFLLKFMVKTLSTWVCRLRKQRALPDEIDPLGVGRNFSMSLTKLSVPLQCT